ncbi:MAG: DUF3568 family protein [Candidatus Methylomirabilis oxyfera]|nr:DUF3568 family protein [Candidatus Methylomirabilis oxyfera]
MKQSYRLREVGPIILLLMAGTLQGCPLILIGGGAAGGGAGVAYAKSELEQVHAAPYEKVWDATLRGLRTLNIAVSETQKDQISAKAVGARADGTAVVVSVLPVTKDSTSVRVRIGNLGDRPASERIQGQIAVTLKEGS